MLFLLFFSAPTFVRFTFWSVPGSVCRHICTGAFLQYRHNKSVVLSEEFVRSKQNIVLMRRRHAFVKTAGCPRCSGLSKLQGAQPLLGCNNKLLSPVPHVVAAVVGDARGTSLLPVHRRTKRNDVEAGTLLSVLSTSR